MIFERASAMPGATAGGGRGLWAVIPGSVDPVVKGALKHVAVSFVVLAVLLPIEPAWAAAGDEDSWRASVGSGSGSDVTGISSVFAHGPSSARGMARPAVPSDTPPAVLPAAGPKPDARGRTVSPQYDALIDEAASEYGVAASLVRAVVAVESGFDPEARSVKGAMGLMQVMPDTGKRFGASDLSDPQTNLRTGTRYLRWLLDRFDSNVPLALAAYNAGEGAVEQYNRSIPPYPETQDYVVRVLARYDGSSVPRQEPVPQKEGEPGQSTGVAAGNALQKISNLIQAALFSAAPAR
ncbi:lytic transglycosylase domain-containing protein [Caballeronia mineralivorans]|uniref:lytic transglycosylase domain-containing protein n=1 Tax=Caballeronia mineralivorans TaxID=2010198 RepID=UPI00069DA2EB|nr:lytic transglycosylase domain-containing protein [Caballeronia mineralivorans]